jgi:hypothetical protein
MVKCAPAERGGSLRGAEVFSSGSRRRMRGGNKVLNSVFYWSASSSLRRHGASRAFYDRKRAQGKRHH